MTTPPTFRFAPPEGDPRHLQRRDSAPPATMRADGVGLAFEGLHALEPGALGPSMSFDVEAAQEDEEPLFDGLDLPIRRGLDAARWLAVERDALFGVWSGEVLGEDDALVWFDTREEVALLLHASKQRVLLCALRGFISVWPADEEDVELGPMPAVPPGVPWTPPALAEWLDDLGISDALRSECEGLGASGRRVDLAVALGRAGRLGRPSDRRRVGELFDRASAWAATQPLESFEELLALTLDRVEDAVEIAEHLVDLLGEDDEENGALVHGLIQTRDDLESVSWVLHLRELSAALRPTLRHLDRRCLLYTTAIDDVLDRAGPPPGGQRWLEVAWREPEAWWVSLDEDVPDEDG